MNRLSFLSEFWRLIRVETCLFIGGITSFGYLILNKISYLLVPVFVSMFFLSAAGYTYNHITDKKEDIVNNKGLNYFVKGWYCYPVMATFIACGVAAASWLSQLSVALYYAVALLALSYSGLRIKRVFVLKNCYTGITIASAFMVGACASGIISYDILMYAPFIFAMGFLLNLLGDIRGHRGDALAGIRTIPVVLGIRRSKMIVYAISAGFVSLSVVMRRIWLYPIIPFIVLIMLFVRSGNHRGARISMLSSFIISPNMLLALNLAGVL